MPDGYFRTGDLGYIDADGYLFIVDRKKDIIIRGGENISCVEVEAAIYAHPDIAEASVFGIPDERFGEIVGAVYVVRDGAQPDRRTADRVPLRPARRVQGARAPVAERRSAAAPRHRENRQGRPAKELSGTGKVRMQSKRLILPANRSYRSCP